MALRLVYLSPVPLASFAQRPHHFVAWMHARHGAEVLWIDPPPARLPRTADLRRLLPQQQPQPLGPAWAQADWLRRLRWPALPFEPYAAGRWLNARLQTRALARLDAWVRDDTLFAFGKPCALALTLRARYRRQRALFDVMDAVAEFAQGRSRRWLAHCETALAAQVDWLVASAPSLLERLAPHACAAHRLLIPNGLDPAAHDPAGRLPAAQEAGGLRFVYVGTIGPWFDWPAVIALAQRMPEATITLVGPCTATPPALPPNVQRRGAVPHARVDALLRTADVGLIPFLDDALTQHVDPVKFYEYRAAGLAVLSTRFGTMRARGAADAVLFFEDAPDTAALAALARRASEGSVRAAFMAAHAWSARFAALDAWVASRHHSQPVAAR